MGGNSVLLLPATMLAVLSPVVLLGADGKNTQAKDLQIVQKFLKQNHPGDEWQQGPAPVENAAIAKAYPDARFYCVFSSQHPVARAGQISAIIRIAKDGSASELSSSSPGGFNTGLMKVQDSKDAQMAAAAIMSLTFGPFGLLPVAPGDVRVAREGRGWMCLATLGDGGSRKPHAFEVHFDADGQCTGTKHLYTGPLPR